MPGGLHRRIWNEEKIPFSGKLNGEQIKVKDDV